MPAKLTDPQASQSFSISSEWLGLWQCFRI